MRILINFGKPCSGLPWANSSRFDVSQDNSAYMALDRDDLGLTEFALSHQGLLASYSAGNLYFSMNSF
jgi:hypothetical protein